MKSFYAKTTQEPTLVKKAGELVDIEKKKGLILRITDEGKNRGVCTTTDSPNKNTGNVITGNVSKKHYVKVDKLSDDEQKDVDAWDAKKK